MTTLPDKKLPGIAIIANTERINKNIVNNIVVGASSTYTSPSIEMSEFKEGLLLVDVDVTLSPTDIVIEFFYSWDDITFFKYMNNQLCDLRYEDSAGDKLECIPIPILAPYMKVGLIGTGTGVINYFTVNIDIVLNR